MTDYNTSSTTRQPGLGERVAELLPGTVEHREKHGLPDTGAQPGLGATVASYIPGTVEYREGLNTNQTGTGSGLTTGNTSGYTGSNTSGYTDTNRDNLTTGHNRGNNGTGLADLTDVNAALPDTGAGYTSGTTYGTGDVLESGTDVTGTGAGYTARPNYSGPSDTVATGTDYNTTGMAGATAGDRVKSKVPGTDEYEQTHGYDRNQERAENVKSYLPGTEEHREKKAYKGTGGVGTGVGTGYDSTSVTYGSTGTGSYGSTGTDTAGAKPTITERIKQVVPGTEEYRETHGDNRLQQRAENAKSYIPGTEENKERKAYQGTGSATTGTDYTGSDTYTGTGMTAGAGQHLAGGFATGNLASQFQEPSYQGVPLTKVDGDNFSGLTGSGAGLTGSGATGATAGMSTGDKIKSKIPGTDEYEAVHGVDKRHVQAENLKAKIPGTDEHKAQKMGGTTGTGYGTTSGTGYDNTTGTGYDNTTGTGYDNTTGTGYGNTTGTGYGTDNVGSGLAAGGVGGTTAGMSMGDKIESKMPGTDEYEAVHGVDKRHVQAENLKAKIPGTDEHKEKKLADTHTDTGYDTNIGSSGYDSSRRDQGLADASDITPGSVYGAGGQTGYDTGVTPATGYDNTSGYDSGVKTGATDYDTTGSGADYDTNTGYDQTGREKEGLGHKLAKHIPGTAARKEYKAEKAAAEGTY